MAILIANIGTSDLAVKIDDYYIPVGFDRHEPNLDESGLTDDEKTIWERELRQSFIISDLCPKLGVPVKENKNGQKSFSFRELTHKLLEAYERDENWHDRIRPGRIWGVLKTAHQDPNFQVQKAYLFVTDQPELIVDQKSGKEKPNPGYPSDSIHLFSILKKWFEREMPNLKLIDKVIPKDIAAVDRDELLNYYYKFLVTEINSEPELLIGIKGGTPQMQNALQIQAISAATQNQLFLNPVLSIRKVLAGESSECQLTSYWRFMRSQKYQTVQQLLKRWDFDGAIQILKQWQETLSFLSKAGIQGENISDSQKLIESTNKTLEIALGYLNLDSKPITRDILDKFPGLRNYDRLLNLYTQCRIFWQLNQVATFLSRLGSFCEETLHELIEKLSPEQYFDQKWYFNNQDLPSQLWEIFYNTEVREFPETRLRTWDFERRNYQLQGRLSKRNFVDALIQYRGETDENEAWKAILVSLKKLDYWIEKRNELIHSAKGVSKETMAVALQADRQSNNTRVKNLANLACEHDQILEEMTNISSQTYKLLNKPPNEFVGLDAHYYIYSEVKDWVINTLLNEGLV